MSEKNKFFIDFDGKPDDYRTRSDRNRGTGLGESDRVGTVVDPDIKYQYYFLKGTANYVFVEQIAFACYGILINALQPLFPLSNEAAPSPFVLITPTIAPLPGNISKLRYPLTVRWDMWQFSAVPVIGMEEINPNNPINTQDIQYNFLRYFRKLYYYVYNSLIENGFLPPLN
jgi:hypothetical protein